jgi:hypothetical protein
MSHICGVSKKFGEWYQKTNKTEDTNKLTLLTFKIIILQNTRLATFIKLLKTVSKGRATAIQERVTAVLRPIPKEAFIFTFTFMYFTSFSFQIVKFLISGC